ncbi:putative cytidine and deoxycytidylate deaminase zinc-binding region protein [Neofusicoccum parvum UCRNP2]|uniref:Putative cytidine and deoxycytidylate deaminase zinc-binding region protein n=1 Tax=Botryosphaeria parva (strain UCR-NP2) TaxID=1287680 RepID=R1EZD6_BOTPV|nr:putative cytidine and deoxycytidylate deaminase zinc-binding region protein [Neofusicoccum parvum UCRNP2]
MVLLAPFRSAPLLPLLLGLASASLQDVIAAPGLSINSVAHGTRAHWMRAANAALADVGGSPCPFAAFGSVVVNHTDADGPGQLVCVGANANSRTGNPTLHGEMAAIANCTAVLTDPEGAYRLSASEALDAFKQLSLYTNAESCPMCASAIRWAGFREYIYGTSIETLVEQGWGQIRVSSLEIFQQSFDLPSQSRLIGELLTNETDPYFLWQYNPDYPCPSGCSRSKGSCAADN